MALHALLLFAMPLVVDRVSTVAKDYERFQGAWVWTAVEEEGRIDRVALGWPSKYVFKGSHYVIPPWLDDEGTHPETGYFHLNPLKEPKEIDIGRGFCIMRGIYEVDGNRIIICYGGERPEKFTSDIDRQWVLHLRRQTIIDSVCELIWSSLPPELRW
jgi:uncharacterized protein (TIGR03067 family)